jgi:polyferredoxin
MRTVDIIGTVPLVAALVILFLGLRTPPVEGQEGTFEAVPSSVEDGELESADGFDDLEEWSDIEEFEDSGVEASGGHRGFRFALIALAFTVVAGFLVRFKPLRAMRTVFLLSSLAFLGFWNGGCPCPISSFQNLALWALNVDVEIRSLWWFLGLIPITYVFGRVWCGWVCHLGALQEFVHKPNRFSFLRGDRAQKTMRVLKYGLVAALIVQLIWTRDNQFIHIDPFKVAFNLRSFYWTGWVLLGVLMLSSLYIYRPFCRSACPVGLILGWVSRLPYASKLGVNEDCRTCKLCTQACAPQAIRVVGREVEVRQQDCLACGSCMDACRKDCVFFYRKDVSNVRETIPSGLGGRSLPVPHDKANGRTRMRERSGGAPETGEGRVEPRLGTGARRTGRVSG